MGGARAIELRVELLRPGAALPQYMTAAAAGLDLAAVPADGGSVTIPPLGRALLDTGLRVAIPEGYEGQIRPRSGLALRAGVTVLNSPGTIDADYRGELKVLLINLGDAPFTVRTGDRIAQLVVAPVAQAALVEVAAGTLEATARGEGGYGHTGIGRSP